MCNFKYERIPFLRVPQHLLLEWYVLMLMVWFVFDENRLVVGHILDDLKLDVVYLSSNLLEQETYMEWLVALLKEFQMENKNDQICTFSPGIDDLLELSKIHSSSIIQEKVLDLVSILLQIGQIQYNDIIHPAARDSYLCINYKQNYSTKKEFEMLLQYGYIFDDNCELFQQVSPLQLLYFLAIFDLAIMESNETPFEWIETQLLKLNAKNLRIACIHLFFKLMVEATLEICHFFNAERTI